jgi:hypothetical protein
LLAPITQQEPKMFVIISVASIILSVTLWFLFPGFIVGMMDTNLWLVKTVLSYLPFIGKHFEAALRMIGIDKMMLITEVGIAIRLFIMAVFRA